MTDSIARFQREASQRERLSSLGRLSTVVAHEIRNPLMIIKTALRSLEDHAGLGRHRPDGGRRHRRGSRRGSTGSSRKCSTSRARSSSSWRPPISTRSARTRRARSAPTVPRACRSIWIRACRQITTDAERLRLALVNILTNARHAVTRAAGASRRPTRFASRRSAATAASSSTSATAASASRRRTCRASSIPTSPPRRTGTGLGLAISRNIIEGLGGTIALSSRPGEGTEVRLELPIHVRRQVTES